MNCEDIMVLLSEYLDGSLDRETERMFEAHVIECERCSALLRTLRAALMLTRNLYGRRCPVPRRIIRETYYRVRIHYRKWEYEDTDEREEE